MPLWHSWLASRTGPSHCWLWACVVTITLAIYSREAEAQLDNETSPTHRFKSRPDLHAPIIQVSILRPELLTPGYVFLAPYRNVDPGPYIYDNYGNLVWSGAGDSGPKTAHSPQVCQYKGKDHLCFFQGEQHQGFARGHGVIMDQSYRIVKTIESSGAGASSDMHEFRMTPYTDGKTALMTVYQPRQYDLTMNPRFNLKAGLGWIVEGVFQEVEIDTERVVFEWRSLDHVDPSQAWTLPGTTDTSGDGLHEQSPWDYFHINSVDKNEEGDYLISARHVSAIYKISGKDGHIIWQLGGNSPSFVQTNFQFSYQHHARWVSENSTHTLFSFFDNASNSFNGTAEFSHGRVVCIDHAANTAGIIAEWEAPEPEGGLLSTSQGNMQLLPNGGVHIGWGEHAYFSEHTADGVAVQYAKVAERASNVMIYRSGKYNWTAQPVTKPALWTFSKTGQARMGFWVSWNGATEVKLWNFYVSKSASGPFQLAGFAEKNGFETQCQLSYFMPWSYAEAIDGAGRTLERSMIARTFVPSDSLRPYCNDDGCQYAERVPLEEEVPYEAANPTTEVILSPNRGYKTDRYYADSPVKGKAQDEEDADEDSDEMDMDDGDDDYSGLSVDGETSTVAVGVGLMLGFTAAVLGFFFWRSGGFRKLQSTTADLADGVKNSKLGARIKGRYYSRISSKDIHGMESGFTSSNSCSHGHSSP